MDYSGKELRHIKHHQKRITSLTTDDVRSDASFSFSFTILPFLCVSSIPFYTHEYTLTPCRAVNGSVALLWTGK